MNYSKVQFVSWELYTGPTSPLGNGVGFYPGLRLNGIVDDRIDLYSQCEDIEARVSFTSNAINKAFEKVDKNSSVLKIFMAPEFLYRGAGGAYLHDLINGWVGSAPTDFNPTWQKTPQNSQKTG
jgi:hypothetical protein